MKSRNNAVAKFFVSATALVTTIVALASAAHAEPTQAVATLCQRREPGSPGPTTDPNISACTRIIAQNPNNATAHLVRGDLYLLHALMDRVSETARKRWKRAAIDDWTIASMLNPWDERIKLHIATVQGKNLADPATRSLSRLLLEAVEKAAPEAISPVASLQPPDKPATAPAQSPDPVKPAGLPRRVALVIGNGAYKVSPLANPVSDAISMAQMLEDSLHFDTVLLRTDLDITTFRQALAEMSRLSLTAEIALVFYAGHGTERDGTNYLIPVDAQLERTSDLDLQSISLPIVLDQIAPASRLKIVMLDACRTNTFPLAGSRRAVMGQGLAPPPQREANMLIVYAAAAGAVASDGLQSEHSPFTAALLRHMKDPATDIRFILGSVADDVSDATGKTQRPHIYGTWGSGTFALGPPAVTMIPTAATK